MDSLNKRRLKLLGHVQTVSAGGRVNLEKLTSSDYPARIPMAEIVGCLVGHRLALNMLDLVRV